MPVVGSGSTLIPLPLSPSPALFPESHVGRCVFEDKGGDRQRKPSFLLRLSGNHKVEFTESPARGPGSQNWDGQGTGGV